MYICARYFFMGTAAFLPFKGMSHLWDTWIKDIHNYTYCIMSECKGNLSRFQNIMSKYIKTIQIWCKCTTLWNNGGKEGQKHYPTSAAYMFNRCRVVFLSCFSTIVPYGSLFACFHPCLVSVLFAGLFLLKMKLCRIFVSRVRSGSRQLGLRSI